MRNLSALPKVSPTKPGQLVPFIDLEKVTEARALFREHMQQISLIEDIKASGKRQKVFLLSIDEKADQKENKKKPRFSGMAPDQREPYCEMPIES